MKSIVTEMELGGEREIFHQLDGINGQDWDRAKPGSRDFCVTHVGSRGQNT